MIVWLGDGLGAAYGALRMTCLLLVCIAGIACGASAYPYGPPSKMAMEEASYTSDGDVDVVEAWMAPAADRRLALGHETRSNVK